MNNPSPELQHQPSALIPLCATEMWERFGFYIVQGLLILLITNHFNLPDKDAYLIMGAYGALVYMSPLVGGFFADRFLGFRYTILLGAAFQCLGYVLISIITPTLMHWGLACVILGNGFLKPNIASFLGEFYTKDDQRRHSGFTYYYMGMNTGAFISTLTAGFIQRAWGWHLCFLIAALGMLVGITIFLLGNRTYGKAGLPTHKNIKKHLLMFLLLTACLCLAIAGISYCLLTHAHTGDDVLVAFGVATLCFLIYTAIKRKKQECRNLIALIWLILFAIIFWAIFFEMFSVVNLFIERNVERHLFGIEWPPLAFLSLESVFIIILGWPLAWAWRSLNTIKKEPSLGVKFALALLALALAMWLLTFAIHHHAVTYLVIPGWLFLFFLLLTLGELLLSPTILSAVTELAPQNLVGMMMGVQYMAIGFGNIVTGYLGQIAAIPKSEHDPKVTDSIYAHAFNTYALISLIAAILIFLSAPIITRLIHHNKK